ncbi:cytochrome B2 [Aspergillus nomiae NRRL 13137]|uniref:L-lactate dehydrogenase (cytochrome) n=1 Tax=Aspergillus nomiae NRRL (strain ATCC 15546 / NRRL 13137 / CBS 260.88 / M93) TaxID=1509407 RepID=A0A0L1J6D9_ASPN3|nr:cytochrome B2 [Aspergillus nomiae NRRL 13137]KNG87307.1 cytochrome B2 [Aspergillus nomiae NRRL 13137]
MIGRREIAKHNSADSCWVVLYGKVYDVTNFLENHPGGSAAILALAGKDATQEYDTLHPPGLLEEYLAPEACLGVLSASTSEAAEPTSISQHSASKETSEEAPLSSLLNLAEIEQVAKRKLSPKGWAYYSSATDDGITKAHNNLIYRSILLRPRVFIDCRECDLSIDFLGLKLGLPIYISPAAMARLAHPQGEAGIAAACRKFGAMQIISHNASMATQEIVANAHPDQVFGWQLYCLKDVRRSEKRIAEINSIKAIKFICLTLDAPFPGKREIEERQKMEELRIAGAASSSQVWGTDASLTWERTLDWLRMHTSLPIILKGIQTYDDVILAAKHAPQVRGIVLSNHGGRALDTVSTPMHVLLEIRRFCPEVLDRLDVIVDGGIQRGTDVAKALALGAKAVGIGRAALYGLAAGGQEGVERTLQILADETATAMRLLGVQRVDQLSLQHVNTQLVDSQIFKSGSSMSSVERAFPARAKF